MPLVEIKNEEAPRMIVACAACEAVVEHELSSLVLGTEHSHNFISLPPCKCGAFETLIRTWDTEDHAQAGHRKAVNAVAHWLKCAGRTHPNAAAALATERGRPKLTRPLIGAV